MSEAEFVTVDVDLTLLLSLAGDVARGEANQDTGIMLLEVLKRVEDRLLPAEPSDAMQIAMADVVERQYGGGAVKLLYTVTRSYKALMQAHAEEQESKRNQEEETPHE